MERLSLFFLFAVLTSHQALAFHPADGDLDSRITIGELELYHNVALAALSEEERKGDADWQQASFIWRNGETYMESAVLAAPYGFLPTGDGSRDYASLEKRYVMPLREIELFADAPVPTTLEAEFRPLEIEEWTTLETRIDVGSGRLFIETPYVPHFWLETGKMEIRATLDGTLYHCGEIELMPPPENFGTTQFYGLMRGAIGEMGETVGVNAAGAANRATAGETLNEVETLFATAHLAAEVNAQAMAALAASDNSYLRQEARIIEELFLYATDPKEIAELERFSSAAPAEGPQSHVSSKSVSGDTIIEPQSIFVGNTGNGACAAISDEVDLLIEAQERCRILEREKLFEEYSDRVDKATEKLGEIAEKVKKGLTSAADAGGARLAGRAHLAVTIPLELWDFKNEWQKSMLPSLIVDMKFEVEEDAVEARGYLLEDSPLDGGGCNSYGLDVFVHVSGEGFDSARFLIDKLPSASDSLPQNYQGFGIEELADTGQQAALDELHGRLQEDLQIQPCRWPADPGAKGIEVSKERFALVLQGGSIVPDPDVDDAFMANSVGQGSVGVQLETTVSSAEGTSRFCVAPFTGTFNFEVRPIEVNFNPVSYNVEDVEEDIELLVGIEDTHETTKELEWTVRDKTGKIIETFTTMPASQDAQAGTADHEKMYDPPDDFDLYPLMVEAKSTAAGCLRASDSTPRKDSATISYQSKAFTIEPNRECIPLNSSVTLTAMPLPGINNLVIDEWEILTGAEGASITKTGDTTATLAMGGEPVPEIELRATGSDEYEVYAYFSGGDCLDTVDLSAIFPPGFYSTPAVNDVGNSTLSSIRIVPDANDLNVLPMPPVPGFPPPQPGPHTVFGIGGTELIALEIEAMEQAGRFEGRFAVIGKYLAVLDTRVEGGVPGTHDSLVGGTYFSDFLNHEPPFEYTSGLGPSTGTYSFGEGLTLRFQHILPESTDDIDFSGVQANWTSLNGTVTDIDRDDEGTLSCNVTWPEEVERPHLELRLLGAVTVKEISESGSEVTRIYSFDILSSSQWERISAFGESTYGFSSILNDGGVICGGWEGRSTPLEFVLGGCCGSLALDGYAGSRGVVRQDRSIAALSDTEEGTFASVNLFLNDSDSPPYCSEVKRLKIEMPDPDPDPVPPDPEPKPDPTPPELEPDFEDSPFAFEGDSPGFPPRPGDDIAQGIDSDISVGGALGGNDINYPYQNAVNASGFRLGIHTQTGQRTATAELVSQASLDFVANSARIVSAGSLSTLTGSGLLVQRQLDNINYLDFWEYNETSDKYKGTTLISGGTDVFLGMGDFNGDDRIDFGAYDATNGDFVIYPGTADGGIGPRSVFYPRAPGLYYAAAAVVPASGEIFLLAHDFNSSATLFRIGSDGSLLGSSAHALPPNAFPRSFADFNGDSVPDLVTHVVSSTTFTVQELSSDGTADGNPRTFTVEMFDELPGTSLSDFPTF